MARIGLLRRQGDTGREDADDNQIISFRYRVIPAPTSRTTHNIAKRHRYAHLSSSFLKALASSSSSSALPPPSLNSTWAGPTQITVAPMIHEGGHTGKAYARSGARQGSVYVDAKRDATHRSRTEMQSGRKYFDDGCV